MSDNLGIAKQWLAKARNDILNADNNLKSVDIPFDTVCFHCQQAAEKLLKAFLVVKGQEYPYTHDLFLLLEKILPLNSEAGSLRDPLSILMPYAVEIRYPDYGFSPTAADAKEAREATGKVLEWMLKVIPELF